MDQKKKLTLLKTSSWLEQAQWRIDNEYWIEKSQKFALRVLVIMDKKKLRKEDVAKQSGISLRKFNKILKGSTNLTLREMCGIQKALDTEILNIIMSKNGKR